MTSFLFTVFVAVLCVGVGLVFFGWAVAFATALGHRQYVFGVSSFLFPPLALVYCALFRDRTAYPAKLLGGGLLVAAIAAVGVWATDSAGPGVLRYFGGDSAPAYETSLRLADDRVEGLLLRLDDALDLGVNIRVLAGEATRLGADGELRRGLAIERDGAPVDCQFRAFRIDGATLALVFLTTSEELAGEIDAAIGAYLGESET